jgi:hypothetical protein
MGPQPVRPAEGVRAWRRAGRSNNIVALVRLALAGLVKQSFGGRCETRGGRIGRADGRSVKSHNNKPKRAKMSRQSCSESPPHKRAQSRAHLFANVAARRECDDDWISRLVDFNLGLILLYNFIHQPQRPPALTLTPQPHHHPAPPKERAMDRDQDSLPLGRVESNLELTPIKKPKFRFQLDERKVERLLNEKRLKHRDRAKKASHSNLTDRLKNSSGIVVNCLPAENLNIIRNVPHDLLPANIRQAALAAKQTSQVYVKPEHWIVRSKPVVTIEERIQREKTNVDKRVDSMKIYSRAAKCLNKAKIAANHIGPIRKKRSPVFDGLICDK